ncbi:MAG: DNA polymerase III subunit delta [Candidatus Humimicrobiaceae bacterium]
MENKKIEDLKALYFIESKSESIIDEKIREIKAYLKDKIGLENDIKIFDLKDDADPSDFYNFLNTPSFFSIKKAAIIKNCEKISKDLLRIISDYFLKTTSPGEGIVIFLTSSEFKKAYALQDIVSKYGEIISIRKPETENLKKRVLEKTQLDGIKITPKALEMFIGNIDGDLNLLENEYEKLFLYVSSDSAKIINEDIVKKLVSRNISFTIFNFVDYVGYKKFKMAADLLPFMAEDEYAVISVIKQLYSMFKGVLYMMDQERGRLEVKSYLEKNTKANPGFILKIISNYSRFAKNYTALEIISIIGILNDSDIAKRKTSQTNINFLYSLLFKIQHQQNP